MKKATGISLAVLALLLIATFFGCSQKQENISLEGTFVAINPPVESGEDVIVKLQFSGDTVRMVSGSDVEQSVNYKIKGSRFLLLTDFGEFGYDFEVVDIGIVIDGITYEKK